MDKYTAVAFDLWKALDPDNQDYDTFEGVYMGTFKTFAQFVRTTFIALEGDVPTAVEPYVDWGKMADDWYHDYDCAETADGLAVFYAGI